MCFHKDLESMVGRIPDNPDTTDIRRQLEKAAGCRTCPERTSGAASDCRCLHRWQVDLENRIEFFLKP